MSRALRLSRYRIHLNFAGEIQTWTFSEHEAREAALLWRSPRFGMPLKFALPEGQTTLLLGNKPFPLDRFSEFRKKSGHLLFLLETPHPSPQPPATIVLRSFDQHNRLIDDARIDLRAPKAALLRVPSHKCNVKLHIRLKEFGSLHPITLHVSAIDPHVLKQAGSQRAQTQSGTQQDSTFAEIMAGRHFCATAIRSRIPSDRRFVGVGDPAAWPAEVRFHRLRLDEALVPFHPQHWQGFVFDETSADVVFGWEGTMTPDNYRATNTLANHLKVSKKMGLTTHLLLNEKTKTKPFFRLLSPLFDQLTTQDEFFARLSESGELRMHDNMDQVSR